MTRSIRHIIPSALLKATLLLPILLLVTALTAFAQPPINDNCANASEIVIPNGGYANGLFTGAIVSTCGATVQPGEFFPTQQINAAHDEGSIWYRFTLPTTKSVRIILRQDGSQLLLPGTHAGWTLYRTTSCFPGAAQMLDPPIINIEGYTHICLKPGTYYVQVGFRTVPCDTLALDLDIRPSTSGDALYDYASSPLDFTVANSPNLPSWLNRFYTINCQSHHENETLCPTADYQQTTWHTFTTDGFVDHIRFEVGENPWNPGVSLPVPRRWGYQLYAGDPRIDSIADGIAVGGQNLTAIGPCKTLEQFSSGNYAVSLENCNLDPNTLYTIKLFHPRNYSGQINVRLYEVGSSATIGPDPTNVPASNQLGSLTLGPAVTRSNVFACNARMSLQPACPNGIPVSGIVTIGGTNYDLNAWYTFELTGDANVTFLTSAPGSPVPGIRLFNGDVMVDGCAGLTLRSTQTNGNLSLNCLPAGRYSVQILGQNNPSSAHLAWASNLGRGFSFSVQLFSPPTQAWGLHTPSERGFYNAGVALPSPFGYTAVGVDVLDCRTTPLPTGAAGPCKPNANRAIYRLINIGQNGILTVSGGDWYLRYRLYRGDASTAPRVGNEIQGLVDQAGCQRPYYWWERFKVCVTPGIYTLVSFGDDTDIGRGDNPSILFEAFPPTTFTDPLSPQVTANLSTTNTTVSSATVRFNCADNPETIVAGGIPYAPCGGATKMTYHEIFVEDELSVTFSVSHSSYQNGAGAVQARIFQGRRSNNTLTGLFANCTGGFTQNRCSQTMAPGWYTIVLYGWEGRTFAAPTYTSGIGGVIGNTASWTLSGLAPYTPQRFQTIARADSSLKFNQQVAWFPNPGHTLTVPHQSRSYNFATEFWDCNHNLPFEPGVVPCGTPGQFNRVSYRVFHLTKPSHVLISGINPWPYGYMSKLYAGDIRNLPVPAPGDEYPVAHPCMHDQFRLCLQPGYYTLVTFANNNHIGNSHTPSIYVDSLGNSKYDHARNAYDFGVVPTNNTEYFGAVGAPLDAFGRTPSDDFFMCTTGAVPTDPYTAANGGLCPLGTFPPHAAPPNSFTPRRNLWYTFQVENPGFVHVTGYLLTPGKVYPARLEVFRSDDLAFTPPAVVDSTLAQGLSFVATTRQANWWWCPHSNTATFYRDPCRETALTRYYVLVTDITGVEPNAQFRLGIRMEPAPPDNILFDHYSQANEINSTNGVNCAPPYPNEFLGAGTFTGCLGNLNCATQDPTDQNTCGTRTIWYKFNVNVSGQIRLNYNRPNGTITWADADMQLYRQVVPGDSTSAGLVRVPLSQVNLINPAVSPGILPWGQGCLNEGTYYIMFTGCNFPTETVIPRIWIIPQDFDLCGMPGAFNVNTFGSYNATTRIDCHSIGEGPGEDGTNMGCFGVPTGRKTQWVRVDVGINDTVDMDVELIPIGMNVIGDSIRYRIGYGNCNSMTFDNCIFEGTNIILNLRCRLPGSYWIQSIMPQWATGELSYQINFTESNTTTCTPLDPLAPNAVFTFNANCVDEPVYFTNFSTSGDIMSYSWNFGDGSPLSSAINPIYQYAAPGTYPVTLIAIKTLDNPDTVLYDTITRLVTVQPRPVPSFTMPATILAGEPFSITNTSTSTIPGSTFLWNFCDVGSQGCGTSPTTSTLQNPDPIVYSTAGTKNICLTIFNGTCLQTYCQTITVNYQNVFTGGPRDGHAVLKYQSVCDLNIFTGGPFDGHHVDTLFEDCLISIFAGGPFDGHGVVKHQSVCELNIFTGGPYDGHDDMAVYENCLVSIFAGGPFDGHAVVKHQSVCTQNIFVGGPYDGHNQSENLAVCVVSIFAGGPFDGHAVVKHAPMCTPNIFVGGPYDGHNHTEDPYVCPIVTTIWSGGPYDGHGQMAIINCPLPENIFAGGPFDGHAVVKYQSVCDLNIFTGGPYDAHDVNLFTPACEVNIFAGGPFDGHAVVKHQSVCSLNIFTGGPYDGHDNNVLISNCEVIIFAGGPFDGHAVVKHQSVCDLNIFTGGPYDGHDQNLYKDFCDFNIFAGGPFDGHAVVKHFSVCLPNVYVGGPYDGHSPVARQDECLLNIWAGGPYDGHGYDVINSFDAFGDEVCIGQTATLTSQSPSDWFTVRTGGVAVATNTTTFTTPVLTQTRVYWAQSVCCPTCPRVPVIASAQRSLTPTFTYVPACTGLNSTFTNTTIQSGTATASIGAGRPISGLATTGTPPGPGQLSFVNGTVNFAMLTNGVHDNNSAWAGANGAAATQWVQWNYITPRSVRRLTWWNAFSPTFQNRQGIVAKLYYGTALGWVMVKAWVLPYPTVGNFDTGLIGETNGLFANRWMLELDVPEANGPNWGEFQAFASTPTIGGGTVTWDFGDGNTATGSPATHNFPNGNGTYTVTMTYSGVGLCPSSVTANVPICDDVVLPILTNRLEAALNPRKDAGDLYWTVEGKWTLATFQKLGPDGQWVDLESIMWQGLTTYTAKDNFLRYGADNFYRVRYETEDGEVNYSNLASLRVEGGPLAEDVRVFPNPVPQSVDLQYDILAPKSGPLKISIYDAQGKLIWQSRHLAVEVGRNRVQVSTQPLAKGMYVTYIETPLKIYHRKFLVMENAQ